MEEINLKDLFNYFLNKKLIIIIVTILSTLIGFIYGCFIKTPYYKSDTSIILISDNKETTLSNSDIQLNESLTSIYQEIIKSRKILNKVIYELDLPYTYEELSKEITVTSISDTSIITITVEDKNSELSYKINNEIARVFINTINEYYPVSNINILDEATLNIIPCNINYIKDTIIFTLIGLILSSGFIFILFYFDRSINSTEQIEKLGLPVLGKVHEGGN